MAKEKKYSMEDVAREADVSIATVSRVFNKQSYVNEETAKRVMQVARRMDYRPNRVARRMRVKASDSLIIGLIIADMENPFFSEIARGVEDIAYKSKNAVMVSNSDEKADKEKFYLETLISERVSGLIIAPTTSNYPTLKKIAEEGYPIVCVDRHPDTLNLDTVTINNELGAYMAVRRLIDLGHRRIGIINGLEGLTTTTERFSGYKKALKEAGIPLIKELIVYEDSRQKGGKEGTRTLLSLKKPPTAVFTTNNLMTLGFLEEMYNQKKKIPDDIALIGFDDMPWAVALNPPLTAVKQPGYELGVTAAELFLKRLNEPHRNTVNMTLNPELIVRKSCGAKIN
ncbi:MAG TPA: LacI family DNA-binding transcriptional regulator [Balneolales bacterium]|nr:LacI family DNA-binding transcriptional regulator [Balneolales bacterium]